jgi:hypothetical protein
MEKIDPVTLSLDENKFLIEHLGEPPLVALRVIPTGVNPKAVLPILEETYTRMQLAEHRGEEWIGVDAVKQALQVYVAEAEKWHSDKRRGRVRFPSMHTFDGKGRPHRGGPGSDSGRVKSYFDNRGERKEFAIELTAEAEALWTPPTQADAPRDGLKLDDANNRWECLVCGWTTSFNPDSRSSQNSARARMSKHLRTATAEPDRHREVHTNEFGGVN